MVLCCENNCTGCSACLSVCPKGAITMEYNERGFLYPKVDANKCVKCGICSKVCSKLEKKDFFEEYHKAYAVKLKSNVKRLNSQSGGLFTSFAETIIENGGIVYGAGFDAFNHVRHLRISTTDGIDNLKKSKYVQSYIDDTYKNVISDLKNGKIVLFSGTPCQVAGIESCLRVRNISMDNFYSCDFICHGVPSPKLYEKYLEFLEKKNGKIKTFCFRDKKVNGWHDHFESYVLDNNEEEKKISCVYSDIFSSNLALRKSCETCQYASKNRPSDITMGDCWGIEKIKPDLWNDNLGVSVCLIQTKKGLELFEMSKSKLDYFEIDSANYSQPNLLAPSTVPYQKENFWNDYIKISFEKLLKKYSVYGGIIFKIKRRILKKIRKW